MKFESLPSPLPNMRMWGARQGGYSWIITCEQGLPSYTAAERQQWVGYTALYCAMGQRTRHATRIEGGPWKTMEEAEAACHAKLKELAPP